MDSKLSVIKFQIQEAHSFVFGDAANKGSFVFVSDQIRNCLNKAKMDIRLVIRYCEGLEEYHYPSDLSYANAVKAHIESLENLLFNVYPDMTYADKMKYVREDFTKIFWNIFVMTQKKEQAV